MGNKLSNEKVIAEAVTCPRGHPGPQGEAELKFNTLEVYQHLTTLFGEEANLYVSIKTDEPYRIMDFKAKTIYHYCDVNPWNSILSECIIKLEYKNDQYFINTLNPSNMIRHGYILQENPSDYSNTKFTHILKQYDNDFKLCNGLEFLNLKPKPKKKRNRK